MGAYLGVNDLSPSYYLGENGRNDYRYNPGGYGQDGPVSAWEINRTTNDITARCSADLERIYYEMENGDAGKATEMYEQLLNNVEAEYSRYGYNRDDIESCLNGAYRNMTGQSMVSHVEQKGSSSFWTGVKQGIPFFGLFANGDSKEEMASRVTGEKVSGKAKAGEYLGAMASGAAAGLAIGFGNPIGAVIGAGAGAVVTFFKNLF